MTQYTNNDLIRHFVRGGSDGQANRMAIQETDDFTLLWGYGWALYAARRKSDNTLFVYNGWYGYSNTTSSHMSTVQGKAKGKATREVPSDSRIKATVTVDADDAPTKVNVEEKPPAGNVVAIDENAAPKVKYTQFNADGREELQGVSVVNPPNGYSTGSRYC